MMARLRTLLEGMVQDSHLAVKCLTQRHAQACLGEVLCRKGTHQRLSYQRLFNAQGGVSVYSPGRLIMGVALDARLSSACVAARSPQLACCRAPPRGTSGSGTPQQSWWAVVMGHRHVRGWHAVQERSDLHAAGLAASEERLRG